jgi:hypothetical protein
MNAPRSLMLCNTRDTFDMYGSQRSCNEENQDIAPVKAGRLLTVLAQCLAAVAGRFFNSPENLAPEGKSA